MSSFIFIYVHIGYANEKTGEMRKSKESMRIIEITPKMCKQ